MTAKGTIFIILICGLGSLLVDSAFDRDWPDHSATWWLVYLGGLVVIALVFMTAERLVARKRDQTPDRRPAEQPR